jgi:hypothetical protein
MTTQTPTQTQNTIHFGKLGKGRGWKDLFVVSFLAIVLGAFVAEISTSHRTASQDRPVASAASAAVNHG